MGVHRSLRLVADQRTSLPYTNLHIEVLFNLSLFLFKKTNAVTSGMLFNAISLPLSLSLTFIYFLRQDLT